MADAVLAGATVLAVVAIASAIRPLLRTAPGVDARSRLMPSLVVLTGGAAITFAAYLAHQLRCGNHCDRGVPPTGVDSLHRWWHRHDAWQWSAQLTIAAAGLALGAIAFALAARAAPRARMPLWLARVAYAAWVLLLFAAPAVYELVNR